ncbi:Netrin receptor UNC5D [Liparis tanakae]|uniref:Netrin receptor UNC5D n=1 Tax=Liparis tanakae TaxID=230148 RepID=A0A4Z2GZ44_9TELE|nr:Netrin receptor UNC5D [Liparis tanakae]
MQMGVKHGLPRTQQSELLTDKPVQFCQAIPARCLNDGTESTEREDNTDRNEVDGGWDEWSEWTVCSSQCEKLRSRECNSPAPRHRGRMCEGNSEATENCTDGLCTQNRKLLHDVKPQSMDSSNDVALYSGLGAGIIAVAILVVAVMLYRKNHSEYGVDVIDSSALTGGFQSFNFKTTRQGKRERERERAGNQLHTAEDGEAKKGSVFNALRDRAMPICFSVVVKQAIINLRWRVAGGGLECRHPATVDHTFDRIVIAIVATRQSILATVTNPHCALGSPTPTTLKELVGQTPAHHGGW